MTAPTIPVRYHDSSALIIDFSDDLTEITLLLPDGSEAVVSHAEVFDANHLAPGGPGSGRGHHQKRWKARLTCYLKRLERSRTHPQTTYAVFKIKD